jgi:hemerythrin superfamily protein
MDAITLLKNDHKTVEALFKRYEKSGERAFAQKREIVDRIIEELSVHASIEESVFYPVTRRMVPKAESIALESLEEHHVVKWLLSELADLDPAHERFDAKVSVLMENVRHHVKEEESEFFPKVRESLSRAQLTDVGDTMVDAKKSAPTHPHPQLPDEGPAAAVAGAVAGVLDRVGDNISGIAQGGVTAAQDLIARLTGGDRPKVSPTGTSSARSQASKVRRAADAAADGVEDTAKSVASGVTKTAQAAKSGAKGTTTSAGKAVRSTASTAKSSARNTASTAKRASTTTARTAKDATKKTAATAKRGARKTTAAASGSR